MSTVNLEEIPESSFGNRLPKGKYILRIIDAKVKESRTSGNNMIVLEQEVVSPQKINGKDDKQVEVGGAKIQSYLSTSPGGLRYQFKPFHTVMGLPMAIDPDALNPELYKGLVVEAICASDEVDEIGEDGKPIVGADDMKITRWRHKVVQYLKKGNAEGVPY